MAKDFNIKKLYYSISEVSKITDVEQYVLRFWESEFEQLKPQKNRAGNRIYTNKDIELILNIKTLLRDKKFTIEGAKKVLENDSKKEIIEVDIKAAEPPTIEEISSFNIDFSTLEDNTPKIKTYTPQDIFSSLNEEEESYDLFSALGKKKDDNIKKDLVEIRNFLAFLYNKL